MTFRPALALDSGSGHCCGKFGLRRAVLNGEEGLRPANQRAVRDTGTFLCSF